MSIIDMADLLTVVWLVYQAVVYYKAYIRIYCQPTSCSNLQVMSGKRPNMVVLKTCLFHMFLRE